MHAANYMGLAPPGRRATGGSILRRVLSVLCWAAVGSAGLLVIARQMGIDSEFGVTALSILPQLTAAAVVCEVGLLLLRPGRLGVVISLAVVMSAVAVQAPAFVPEPQPAELPALTVMTANLRLGMADPDGIVALTLTQRVDVLAVQELTEPAVGALAAAGLDREYPYRVLTTGESGAGAGLWSRYPLTNVAVLNGFGFAPVRADLTTMGHRLTIVSFHSKAPLYNGGTAQWAADLDRISGLMATTGTPLIVAGDFNATNDHRQFRELLTNGYTDSAQDTGTGYLPTYPADGPLGPLAGLDHVLLGSGLLGRQARSADLPGSDHRAVIVSVGILPAAN